MSILKKALAGVALTVLVGAQAVSYDVVVDRMTGRVVGYIRAHLQDHHTAEDLAQEVFLLLYQKISAGEAGPFENEGHLAGYVLRIAYFKVIREFRVLRRKPEPKRLETDPCAPPGSSPVDPEPGLESIYPFINDGYAAALEASVRGDKVQRYTLSRARKAAREAAKVIDFTCA